MANPSKEKTASLATPHPGAGGRAQCWLPACSWGLAARAGLNSGQLAAITAQCLPPSLRSSFSFLGNYSEAFPYAQISTWQARKKKYTGRNIKGLLM